MEFSLFYFANEVDPDQGESIYRLLLDGARFADSNGFTAVWMPERHFHPFGGVYPNPAVTGAAIATITERVQIRAGSVVAPLHHPIRIAEEWAVVDNLSNGRVAISFAPGWHTMDFVFAPERYADRKAITLAAVEGVRALWRGEEVGGTDGTGAPVKVRLHPRPVQPELPVWLTTSGTTATFEAAGRLGANVLTHVLHLHGPSGLGPNIASYRAALRAAHPGQAGHVTLMLHTFMGHDLEAVRERVREPLIRYLRSSLDLRVQASRNIEGAVDPSKLGERERDFFARRAFDRHFETSGLFGPPRRCVEVVERLAAAGVDEIACLIDFGPDAPATMKSLELVAELREATRDR